MREKEYDVFISHSSKDKEIVEKIVEYLKEKQISCFVSFHCVKAGEWSEDIASALKISKMMVYVHSATANKSSNIDDEITAFLEYKRTIIPFRLDNTECKEARKLHLIRFNWVNGGPKPDSNLCVSNPEEHFERLLEFINGELSKESSKRKPSDLNHLFLKEMFKLMEDYYNASELMEEGCDVNSKELDDNLLCSDKLENKKNIEKVKEFIHDHFLTNILGQLISNLFNTEMDSQKTLKFYITNCYMITLYIIELVFYSFLSKLLDDLNKKSSQLPKLLSENLSDKDKREIQICLTQKNDDEQIDAFILKKIILLYKLIKIYSEEKIEMPIPKIKDIINELAPGGKILEAFLRLSEMFSSEKAQDYKEAEKNLTVFLSHFVFLTEYKVISVKNVGYKYHRREKFFRCFHEQEQIKGKLTFTRVFCSDAVMLYTGDNYIKGINLYPFVIDFNSLSGNDNKVLIYLFSSRKKPNGFKYTAPGNDDITLVKENILDDIDKKIREEGVGRLDKTNIREANIDFTITSFNLAIERLKNKVLNNKSN